MENVRGAIRLKDRMMTLLVALATLLSVVVISAAPAGAATLDVCPVGCTYATISDALAVASDTDVISVGVGTYNETITITNDVTIERTEASGTVTIDGGDAGSVVTVPSGTTATLRNLTIRNGNAVDGGGIHNSGDLRLDRVNVFENDAVDPASGALGRGGGIYNVGSIDIQRGGINGNSGEWGGGIANLGTLTSFGTGISGNLADSALGGGGAGIANIGSAATATLEAVTLINNYARDGSTAGRGGGALWTNGGTVVIDRAVLRINRSDFEAGAVYVAGTSAVTIREAVIYDSSSGRAAAIYSRASLTVEDSTIGPNNVASSGAGGAIRVGSTSNVTMRNTTISGNTSGGSGGGALVEGTLSLDSVTIARNTASDGGGVLVTGGSSGGTLMAENSIIAGNTATSTGPDCWGALATSTVVLLSDTGNCTITGTSIVADPQLGPLANNGGFTNTHLPALGSPAIDAGTTLLATDQRGLPRPSGSGPDVGSVEVQTTTDGPPVITPIADPTINEAEALTVTPNVSDPEGDPFTLTWSGVPAGAVTGSSLTWTPTESQGPGSYLVTVTATQDDDPSLSNSESFTIFVSEVNVAPVLDPIPSRTAIAGQELSFTANATDADIPEQDLSYSLDAGAPAGAAIDADTGLFTWTPDATQLGGATITVIVSDGTDQASQTFLVTVVEAAIEADVFVSRFEIVDLDPDGDGDILSQTPVVFEIEYGANSLYGDAPDATVIVDYESIADSLGEFAGVVVIDPGPCDLGSGGIGAGEILVCEVGAIAAGEVRAFTIILEPTLFSFGDDYEVGVDFGTRIETSAIEPDLSPFDNNELRLVTTVRSRQADLQPGLAKYVPLFGTPQPVFFGETSLFEMQAFNFGPDSALDTTLTLTWRADAWELASTPPGCTFVDETTGLTCSYGAILGEPGSSTVNGGPKTVVGLTETGGLGANHDLTVVTGTASVDPFPGNDSSRLEVTPQDRVSDVSITDLRVFLGDPDGDGVVRSGDEITYRATIANGGPDTSVDTSIIVTFPGQFSDTVEVIDAGGCTPFDGVFPSLNQGLRCDIGQLLPLGFRAVEFKIRIPTDESGLWVVHADARTGSVDPDETNDARSDSLDVVTVEADLSTFVLLSTLSDVDQDDDMWLGDTARYTVTAVNDGPDIAENARVLVTVEAERGVDYDLGSGFSCSPAGDTNGFATYECPVGNIDSGGFTPFASAFVPIDWLQTGTFTIRATAASDLPDLDPDNTSQFVTVVQDPSADTDGDGIEDAIDGYRADPSDYNSFVYEDGTPSIQFSDRARVGQSGAGTTFGRVVAAFPPDVPFRIIDVLDGGVTVAMGGSLTDWIDLRACTDDRPVRVWGQSTVDITCGSITVAVRDGRATVTFGDGSTADIEKGSTVVIDDADELTVEVGAAILTSGPYVVVLEAGESLADPGGDEDGDGLTGIEEAFVGTDPEIADTDDDGIGDAIDVDWLHSAIDGYKRTAFVNNGKIKAIGSILDDIDAEVRMFDLDEAAALVRNLSRHSDGCPTQPDNNDWIVDCDVQAGWMELLDLYIRGLSDG